MAGVGEWAGGQWGYWKSLYLQLNFDGNLELLFKKDY